jgi:cob(I)alamin adenosyltransferase
MKIYTKTGDSGETSLFSGGRVPKSSIRIETYGTTDELNSSIGLARSFGLSEHCEKIAVQCQNDLFVLGADLATPASGKIAIDRISELHIERLEQFIDETDTQLEPLKFFILPAGTQGASALHLARTICRRAERICIKATETEDISSNVIIYLNRLSDLLFVMARFENAQSGIPETRWQVR